MCVFEYLFSGFVEYEVTFLGCMVIVLTFWRTVKLVCSHWKVFLPSSMMLFIYLFLNVAIVQVKAMKHYLLVTSVLISLVTTFLCVSWPCVSFWGREKFVHILSPFLNWTFWFFFCENTLHILGVRTLSDTLLGNLFYFIMSFATFYILVI